jgi:CO/xanthine dehydrogenase FAD-binding subunit
MPQARGGRPLPDMLIDLKTMPRLVGVTSVGGVWTIGAATPVLQLTRDKTLSSDFPGLVEAAGLIGSNQVQSRASLGGNLCNASPAADTGPALVVNDVRAVLASTRGERIVPVSEVTLGPGRTSLEPDEFIVEFLLDPPGPGQSDAYQRFTPRTEMDIAVVGAAASVTVSESGECTSASVVLGAVGPTTTRVDGVGEALTGHLLDEDALEEAAMLSRDQARPIDDKRGTKEFRRHIAGVLTKRVLRTAAERAATRT